MSMSPAWIAEKTSSAIPGQKVCNDTASLVELGKGVNWQQSFWNHSINAKWLDHFTHKIRTTTPLPKTACIPSLLKGRLSNSTLTSSLFVDHNCSDLSRHFIISSLPCPSLLIRWGWKSASEASNLSPPTWSEILRQSVHRKKMIAQENRL